MADDMMQIQVGDKKVTVHLATDASGHAIVSGLEGHGFEHPEQMNDFVQLVCGRVVALLLPAEQRERLAHLVEGAAGQG